MVNADCAGRELTRLEGKLAEVDGQAILIGQSRGGTLARALAARHPEAIAALVTLGAPVLDPLAISPAVLRTVRSLARFGDLGAPRMFSTSCRDGACCAEFRALLEEPLDPECPRSRSTPAAMESWIGGRAWIPTPNASRWRGATAAWR